MHRYSSFKKAVVSIARTVIATATVACASLPAQAGPYHVYGSYWAFDNDWGGGSFNWQPSSGNAPLWKASFNFSTYKIWGYPSSIRGWHYNSNPSGDTLFPKQLQSTRTIPTKFSYASAGTNMAGDFAYDMFLRWDTQHTTPQLEVMVWAGNNSYPLGSVIQTGAIRENGVTYDLWGGMNNQAGYYVYTFLPQRSSVPASLPTGGSSNVDMMHFFQVLQGRGYFDKKMYLDVVEAGCEVTRGNGWVSTTAFQVTAQ